MSNSIAVYTSITGSYEGLKTNQVYDGADFYCFTDQKPPSDPGKWTVLPATNLFSDPRMNARYHKILAHEMFPDYEYTIWIDGSLRMNIKAQYFIDHMTHNMMTFKHPVRNCVYDEAEEVFRLQLDEPKKIAYQVNRLKDWGYPAQNGLAETKVVIRRNTGNVVMFNEEWFYQLATGSARDQLSFNPAATITGTPFDLMIPLGKGNPLFSVIKKHKRHLYKRAS